MDQPMRMPPSAAVRWVTTSSESTARLRHASAKTTLDTYAHLWPDADDSTRAAIDAVMAARADSLRTAGSG